MARATLGFVVGGPGIDPMTQGSVWKSTKAFLPSQYLRVWWFTQRADSTSGESILGLNERDPAIQPSSRE